ncbi:hypothetical protein GALMADRAFT_149249 [Galerina marginata CBS 339.88]|uniref:Uncharacterized protein n=1 Tax=Galerina marginata (strain CBS 339.88) TaxID=685588 RepID=A0A067S221_GALM3|nr:hypothetical protein GALMADRAFT_149249 [Galerina marginata CBS 339.88]
MLFFQQRLAEEEYRVHMRLSGSEGPINALAFAPDAKYIASGGDDEKLRVWDISRKQVHQVIGDDLERWGQITCILWLAGFSDHGDALCFGTGRGLVLIYQKTKDGDHFKELSSTGVAPF